MYNKFCSVGAVEPELSYVVLSLDANVHQLVFCIFMCISHLSFVVHLYSCCNSFVVELMHTEYLGIAVVAHFPLAKLIV